MTRPCPSRCVSRGYTAVMQELWVRKRRPAVGHPFEVEIHHAAKPGAPFKKVTTVSCHTRKWSALKAYLLDTDREVVEE